MKIAIDGTAASGKGTLSNLLSKTLKLPRLDTGLLYRKEAFNYINLIIGFFISMIIAFLTIKLFLNFVERIGMIPFVIYRIILGFFLIILI